MDQLKEEGQNAYLHQLLMSIYQTTTSHMQQLASNGGRVDDFSNDGTKEKKS
jgi:hypothetical protein